MSTENLRGLMIPAATAAMACTGLAWHVTTIILTETTPADQIPAAAAAVTLALSLILGGLWLRVHRSALPWGVVWLVAAAACPAPAVVAAQALIIAGATALSEGSLLAILMSGVLACLGDWALARAREDLSHDTDTHPGDGLPARRSRVQAARNE